MTHPAAVLRVLDRRLDATSVAPVGVGFSGGSDSTALLLFACTWAARAGRPILALTVDHGLHPDSAAWTATAGAMAQRLGAAWRALPWRGPKPTTGLPAAARAARHALLADATREAGAGVLLLGHTADDVAESELIRAETPGHGRLWEWSPSPVWPQGRGVFVLRPLLASRRRELRSWVEAQGVGWLDDPANEDQRFARARARRRLQALCPPVHPALPEAWTPRAAPEQPVRMVQAWGGIEVDRAALLGASEAGVLLRRAILCASGGARPPAQASIAPILERLAAGAPLQTVLAGARVAAVDGGVRLTRELGRQALAPPPLAGDAPQVFDGRFEIVGAASGATVRWLAGSAAQLPKREREALRRAPADVRPSLPLLQDTTGAVHLPAPFGPGPTRLRSLVGARLQAALGLVSEEAGIGGHATEVEDHGGGGEAVLSCPAETELSRQAAAARRPAVSSRRMRA